MASDIVILGAVTSCYIIVVSCDCGMGDTSEGFGIEIPGSSVVEK